MIIYVYHSVAFVVCLNRLQASKSCGMPGMPLFSVRYPQCLAYLGEQFGRSQVTSGMIHDLKKGLCQGTRKDLTIHELLCFFPLGVFLEAGKFRWKRDGILKEGFWRVEGCLPQQFWKSHTRNHIQVGCMTKLGIPTIFRHHSLMFPRSWLDLKSPITCGQNASVGSQGAISHREKNWNQKFLACKSDLWKSFLWAFKGWRCFLGGWIEQAAMRS